LTYAIGIAELVNVSVATPTVFVVPGWIALVSIVLLLRPPPQGFELDTRARPAST
jgi:hypothetical protein